MAFVCRPQSEISRYLIAPVSSLMIKPLRMLGTLYCVSVSEDAHVYARISMYALSCIVVYQKASRSYRSGSILSFCSGWRRTATSARRYLATLRFGLFGLNSIHRRNSSRPDALTIGTRPKTQIIELTACPRLSTRGSCSSFSSLSSLSSPRITCERSQSNFN